MLGDKTPSQFSGDFPGSFYIWDGKNAPLCRVPLFVAIPLFFEWVPYSTTPFEWAFLNQESRCTTFWPNRSHSKWLKSHVKIILKNFPTKIRLVPSILVPSILLDEEPTGFRGLLPGRPFAGDQNRTGPTAHGPHGYGEEKYGYVVCCSKF